MHTWIYEILFLFIFFNKNACMNASDFIFLSLFDENARTNVSESINVRMHETLFFIFCDVDI